MDKLETLRNEILNAEDLNIEFSATYSAEDNKLRITVSDRLSRDAYLKLVQAGFKYAPKQEIFVCPKWRPESEDLCLALAGSIEPEQMTMIERAEIRAARFDGYRQKRTAEANYFQDAASRYSERFAYGQPILVGHHSERSARRDQKRSHSAMQNAVKKSNTADYWSYRAEGVERHANRKNSNRTRANRIKKLFAELRSVQRSIDADYRGLEFWQQIAQIEDSEIKTDKAHSLAGNYKYGYSGGWDDATNGLPTDEMIAKGIARFERSLNSDYKTRWISHILNRLGYEIDMQGEVSRFEGEIKATILQTFCRTHGADKPKAKKIADSWSVTCDSKMPVHLSADNELTLSAGEWCDLMQKVGYSVAEKTITKSKKAQLPLLNINAESINMITRSFNNKLQTITCKHLSKAEYKRITPESKGTRTSACGLFRLRYAWVDGGYYAVFITDQKAHDVPTDSDSVNNPIMKEAS